MSRRPQGLTVATKSTCTPWLTFKRSPSSTYNFTTCYTTFPEFLFHCIVWNKTILTLLFWRWFKILESLHSFDRKLVNILTKDIAETKEANFSWKRLWNYIPRLSRFDKNLTFELEELMSIRQNSSRAFPLVFGSKRWRRYSREWTSVSFSKIGAPKQ